MVVSPEVTAEKKVIFRILAPNAQAVKVMGGDIPGNRRGRADDQGRERSLGGHAGAGSGRVSL